MFEETSGDSCKAAETNSRRAERAIRRLGPLGCTLGRFAPFTGRRATTPLRTFYSLVPLLVLATSSQAQQNNETMSGRLSISQQSTGVGIRNEFFFSNDETDRTGGVLTGPQFTDSLGTSLGRLAWRSDGSIAINLTASTALGCDRGVYADRSASIRRIIFFQVINEPAAPVVVPPISIRIGASATSGGSVLLGGAAYDGVAGFQATISQLGTPPGFYRMNHRGDGTVVTEQGALVSASTSGAFEISAGGGVSSRSDSDAPCRPARLQGGTSQLVAVIHGFSATDATGRAVRLGLSTDSAGSGQTYRDVVFDAPVCPEVVQHPLSSLVCIGSTSLFQVSITGAGPFAYLWRKDGSPIDALANPSAATASLTITNASPADVASYDCIVTNACDSVTSNPATLAVQACGGCSPADIAGGGENADQPDGTVDGTDFIAFINSFGIGDASFDSLADIVGGGDDGLLPDGTIDGSDFIAFINAFAVGC